MAQRRKWLNGYEPRAGLDLTPPASGGWFTDWDHQSAAKAYVRSYIPEKKQRSGGTRAGNQVEEAVYANP